MGAAAFAASTTNQTQAPITKTNMDLFALFARLDQGDFSRAVAEAVPPLPLGAPVKGLIGAVGMARDPMLSMTAQAA